MGHGTIETKEKFETKKSRKKNQDSFFKQFPRCTTARGYTHAYAIWDFTFDPLGSIVWEVRVTWGLYMTNYQ